MKVVLRKGVTESVLRLVKNKISNPSIKIKNSYGYLTKDKPNYPTLSFTRNGVKYYLLDGYPERTIQFDYTGNNSSSNGTWNTYKEYIPEPEFMLADKVKCDIKFKTTQGNFDHITIRVYYINVDTDAQIIKDKGWGDGGNWSGTFSGSYELTNEEIEKLGGAGAVIKFGCQSNNNYGSAYVSIEATITVSTFNSKNQSDGGNEGGEGGIIP